MTMRLSTNRSFFMSAIAATVLAFASVGCSSPVPSDPPPLKSKVGTGEAMLKTTASKASTKATGIARWQVTRGKQNFVIKGFSASNKVVAGVALGFHKKTATEKARVTGTMLDGSGWTMEHRIGGSTTSSGKMSARSKVLVNAMFTDLGSVHHGMTKSNAHAKGTCDTDLVDTLMNALECMASATTATEKDKCMVSMKAAASSAQSCEDGSSTSSTSSTSSGSSTTSGTTPDDGDDIDDIDDDLDDDIDLDDDGIDDDDYDDYDDGADLDDGDGDYEDGDYDDDGYDDDYDDGGGDYGDDYGDDGSYDEAGGGDVYDASLRLFRKVARK